MLATNDRIVLVHHLNEVTRLHVHALDAKDLHKSNEQTWLLNMMIAPMITYLLLRANFLSLQMIQLCLDVILLDFNHFKFVLQFLHL